MSFWYEKINYFLKIVVLWWRFFIVMTIAYIKCLGLRFKCLVFSFVIFCCLLTAAAFRRFLFWLGFSKYSRFLTSWTMPAFMHFLRKIRNARSKGIFLELTLGICYPIESITFLSHLVHFTTNWLPTTSELGRNDVHRRIIVMLSQIFYFFVSPSSHTSIILKYDAKVKNYFCWTSKISWLRA